MPDEMQKEGGKMVYWKLDNHTIRCLINKEEIKKMGFDLNDISKDADVMTEFLEAIVSDSHNYIDWNTENGVQIYIAKALPADQFLFTISCSFPDDMIDQDLRQIRRMINALNDKIPLDRLDEIEKLSGEEKERAFASLSRDLREVCTGDIEIPSEKALREMGFESGEDRQVEKAEDIQMPPQKVTFGSMAEIMSFCSLLDTCYTYPSSLYRLRDEYILLVDFDDMDDKVDIIRFLITAEEYGAICEATQLSRYYLLEHGELLIEGNAIEVLITMARS